MSLKAVIQVSNSYVNATNFTPSGDARNYAKWKTTDKSKALIEAFKKQEKTNVYEQEIKSTDKEVQGTYVHPTVMTLFLFWYSPDTAVGLADTLVMSDKIIHHLSKANELLKGQSEELIAAIKSSDVHNSITLMCVRYVRKQLKQVERYFEEAKTNPEVKEKLDKIVKETNQELNVTSISIMTWNNNVELLHKRGLMKSEFGWH